METKLRYYGQDYQKTAQLHLKKMVLSYAEMCGSDKKAIDLFR